jgi:hypothetical protein
MEQMPITVLEIGNGQFRKEGFTVESCIGDLNDIIIRQRERIWSRRDEQSADDDQYLSGPARADRGYRG